MVDYLKYYDLEQYLFNDVRHRFHSDHSIGAFDFFSIVIWKANRAKSRIAKRLWDHRVPPRENDLESIVRRLTLSLYEASDHRERLRLLWNDWDLRLPMASAILSVLWPEDFSVYDFRVCGRLRAFHGLADRTSFEKLWLEYREYVTAVRRNVDGDLSLRDKDRYLWGCSAAEQLDEDLMTRFGTDVGA